MSTILRWTSSVRALRHLKRHWKVITARDFNLEIRDRRWTGHIGRTNAATPSCGCQECTRARFNMKVT